MLVLFFRSAAALFEGLVRATACCFVMMILLIVAVQPLAVFFAWAGGNPSAPVEAAIDEAATIALLVAGNCAALAALLLGFFYVTERLVDRFDWHDAFVERD